MLLRITAPFSVALAFLVFSAQARADCNPYSLDGQWTSSDGVIYQFWTTYADGPSTSFEGIIDFTAAFQTWDVPPAEAVLPAVGYTYRLMNYSPTFYIEVDGEVEAGMMQVPVHMNLYGTLDAEESCHFGPIYWGDYQVHPNYLHASNLTKTVFTIQPVELEFHDGITVLQDTPGNMGAFSPVWTSTAAAPIAYVAGSTVRANGFFEVTPTPRWPLPVWLSGYVEGVGGLSAEVWLPTDQGQFEACDPMVDAFCFYADWMVGQQTWEGALEIHWYHSFEEYPQEWHDSNSSATIPFFVTLATPFVIDGPNTIPFSVLKLATAGGGATTAADVFQNTWDRFKLNLVKNWDDLPLSFLSENFATSAFCEHFDPGQLLMNQNRSGPPSCFAFLLLMALQANGLGPNVALVVARSNTSGEDMVFNNWHPVASNGEPSPSPYSYRVDFNSAFGLMDPAPNQGFGDISNDSGIAGQNTSTPVEKVFPFHVLMLVVIDGITTGPFFDPSLGRAYDGANEFEEIAVFGFIKRIPNINASGHLRISGSYNVEFWCSQGGDPWLCTSY